MSGKQKMNYKIRPCSTEEAVYIEEQFWKELGSIAPSEESAEEQLIVFKVTDEDENIIGGCVLDIDTLKIAEFNSIWVDEQYRRQGIGTSLVSRVEQAAKDKGCSVIYNNFNFDFQDARPLFEKNGYALCGITKGWPKGHEGYYLVKHLDRPHEEHVSSKECGYVVTEGSDEDGEYIGNRLEDYNSSIVPRSHSYLEMDRAAIDDEGNVIGGCIAGVSGWDTLHLDLIWVDGPYRNHGIGSALLRETECEAEERGAHIALAGAIEQQSGFVRKRGYSVDAIQEDCPKYYVMHKQL